MDIVGPSGMILVCENSGCDSQMEKGLTWDRGQIQLGEDCAVYVGGGVKC